ncbi:MAG: site-specific DNA-methyltransferase, partial [Thermoflexales bacterium]|nr:site-specific DNA-methyltransferase [Thermoflexales bacterium]
MAKIEITKTELVWPGKYNEDGTLKEVPRVSLPFQVIETINESRATREARKEREKRPTLFDIYEGKEGDTFEDGWKNKLIWGDNLLVMGSLLEKFAGKIDLIYIDPPFATGADFSFTAPIGEGGDEVFKEQSVIEEKAYRDMWGGGLSSYITILYNCICFLRELLSDRGCIYIHCDWRVNYALRAILDEIMGTNRFINEIIWSYKTGGIGERWFSRKHDTIFLYSKSGQYTFNKQYEKSYLTSGMASAREGSQTAQKYGLHRDEEGVYRMASARDVWEIMPIYRNSPELLGYPTQKPEALLDRIIRASSTPGDLVADFFCGSGTTLAVAEKLGRRWIGCDLGRWAIHVTRKRLLSIPN